MLSSRYFAAVAFLLAGTVVTAARADHFSNVRHDAAQLSEQADQLFHEVQANLQHAANYRSLVVSASRLRVEAIHFERALGSGRARDLERQVDSLDHLAHDLSDEIFDASRGPRYHRFAQPCDTRLAQRLIRSIENTVHCLDDHLADLPNPTVIVQRPLPYNPPRYAPPPSRPIQFGAGGFSIQFGR